MLSRRSLFRRVAQVAMGTLAAYLCPMAVIEQTVKRVPIRIQAFSGDSAWSMDLEVPESEAIAVGEISYVITT